MKIFDEIEKICGITEADAMRDFCFSCLGNSGLALEGTYKITSFSAEEIVLKLPHSRCMKILGKGLKIGTLAPFEIGIVGLINSIAFEGKGL